jgi:biofilm PGA synthesis N-glycosyltransferase PgaC
MLRSSLVLAIVAICMLNLLRMGIYLISGDIYSLHQARTKIKKSKKRAYLPTVTVVVPAHNEEKTIERALWSLYESDYPARKLEVIVVNDGSTDNTKKVVQSFQHAHLDRATFRLVTQVNKGKAAALNHAIKDLAHGKLIMCLDADSYLAPASLRHAVAHFRDRRVTAVSSNVNIIKDGSLLSLVQRIEYIICYQMKKGQALLNVEYIVGGIGSMFRKSVLEKVSYYDTNTMTEDIDLTMKIILKKSKNQRIAYAADSITYTEAAHTLKELMNQRFRWKYGRSQTFLKNSKLFFSRHPNQLKRLTWFMLPFALVQDVFFFLEPLILAYFLYISIRYDDPAIFISASLVISFYILCNIWASDHLSIQERLRLSLYAPFMYILMFSVSYAEYYALLKAIILSPKLRESIDAQHITWKSPSRRQRSLLQTDTKETAPSSASL